MCVCMDFALQVGDKNTPECSQSIFEDGISRAKSHFDVRGVCIKEYETAYGYMPLTGTTFQGVRPWCKPYHYLYNFVAFVYNLL